MCCECCCSEKRCCCDPIIPVEKSESAKCWRYTVIAILVVHFAVIILKMIYLGITSALTDVVGFTVLVIAAFRVDYCLALVFAVANLFETFSIIVILGYFLQTDLGQNVPNKKDPNEPDTENKGQKDHHQSLMQSHTSHKTPIVYWRSLIDEMLKYRYQFYADMQLGKETPFSVKPAVVQNPRMPSLMQKEKSDVESPEDPKSLRLQEHGSTFLIVFCSLLITWYIVSSCLAHLAYREWKGIAEDCAGGSVTMTTRGNVLHYAIIDKREDDAKAEKEYRRKRIAELKKQAGLNANNDDPEQEPLNNNENQEGDDQQNNDNAGGADPQ